MSMVALACAGLAGLVHVYIFVLESLRWEEPGTRRVFGLTPEQAAATRELAYNQGFYNLFLAIGALAGAGIYVVDRAVGSTLVVASCASMAAAAAVLVLRDRSKLRPAAVQGVLPAAALLFLALGAL